MWTPTMKQQDIRAGNVYCNAGRGFTQRSVIGIGVEYNPKNTPTKTYTDEVFVLYVQNGGLHELGLLSFSRWAGKHSHALSNREWLGYQLRYDNYRENVLKLNPLADRHERTF